MEVLDLTIGIRKSKQYKKSLEKKIQEHEEKLMQFTQECNLSRTFHYSKMKKLHECELERVNEIILTLHNAKGIIEGPRSIKIPKNRTKSLSALKDLCTNVTTRRNSMDFLGKFELQEELGINLKIQGTRKEN